MSTICRPSSVACVHMPLWRCSFFGIIAGCVGAGCVFTSLLGVCCCCSNQWGQAWLCQLCVYQYCVYSNGCEGCADILYQKCRPKASLPHAALLPHLEVSFICCIMLHGRPHPVGDTRGPNCHHLTQPPIQSATGCTRDMLLVNKPVCKDYGWQLPFFVCCLYELHHNCCTVRRGTVIQRRYAPCRAACHKGFTASQQPTEICCIVQC